MQHPLHHRNPPISTQIASVDRTKFGCVKTLLPPLVAPSGWRWGRAVFALTRNRTYMMGALQIASSDSPD
ncbi:hypothetical protein RRG08_051909 [Elysia crispata]|uniref:Uncharacterized protein n=1 Tax=Elysia crispata TaxID=231223 RepID=A0AAE0Y1S3_9GAST|nr:hypothetical protein RRG08_051909 [Elysia crispata]